MQKCCLFQRYFLWGSGISYTSFLGITSWNLRNCVRGLLNWLKEQGREKTRRKVERCWTTRSYSLLPIPYLSGCTGPSLWCAGSLVGTCRVFLPNQRSNLGPLRWECGVLATGPPGKSSFRPSFNEVTPVSPGDGAGLRGDGGSGEAGVHLVLCIRLLHQGGGQRGRLVPRKPLTLTCHGFVWTSLTGRRLRQGHRLRPRCPGEGMGAPFSLPSTCSALPWELPPGNRAVPWNTQWTGLICCWKQRSAAA